MFITIARSADEASLTSQYKHAMVCTVKNIDTNNLRVYVCVYIPTVCSVNDIATNNLRVYVCVYIYTYVYMYRFIYILACMSCGARTNESCHTHEHE